MTAAKARFFMSILCYRNYSDEMLLHYAADMDDEDFEILLVGALCKEPSRAMFGFKINVDSLEEQTSIELFRKHSVSFLTKPYFPNQSILNDRS